MSGYEQSSTESRNGKVCTKTRQSIYQNMAISIDSEIVKAQAQERYLQNLKERGNGKYTVTGSNDRVNGLLCQADNKELYKTRDDRQSYLYGYAVHGARRLEGIVFELEKAGKYAEVEALGVRDYELGIPKELLGNLVKYENYMKGYNSSEKGKTRR